MIACHECGTAVPGEAAFCPHCGSRVSAELGQPLIGSLVDDRYRVTARLGQGGVSVVYLARHERLGREVALKVLRSELVEAPAAVARFAREAWAAAQIAHDNIVQVFDFGRAPQGFHYIAMEYVPGVGLDRELEERGPLVVPRAVHVLAQIATGLAAAHSRDVVHRDLKPSNVMLTRRAGDQDFVKVVDFGLARSLDAELPSSKLTMATAVLGTPGYMAPECWEGSVADARADVYALGAMAYELLTGELPYECESIVELMYRHCNDPIPRPSAARDLGSAGPALDAIVASCMRKEAEARPSTARALLELIVQVPAGTPVLRRTTYARPLLPTVTPDPTVFEPGAVDIVWDGAMLCLEVARLRELRRERLDQLLAALAPGPPDLDRFLAAAARADDEARRATDPIRELDAEMTELDHVYAEREAELRGRLVAASLDVSVAQNRLGGHVVPRGRPSSFPPPPSAELPLTKDTQPDAPLSADPAVRLLSLERKLSSIGSECQARRHQLRAATEQAVQAAAPVLASTTSPWELLSGALASSIRARRDLRPVFAELAKVDGAIASYSALLSALASAETS